MNHSTSRVGPIFFSLFYLSLSPSASAQGSLTPPGPPAPTMKALDHIASTGIPINAENVTATDADYEFVISKPGNYFLTGNLLVNKSNGIQVTTQDVTIDLNGFAVRRGSTSTGSAIEIGSTANHCTIKNGSINGITAVAPGNRFTYGVRCISLYIARGGSFLNLAVAGCSTGLSGGDGWLIDACRAEFNGLGIEFNEGGIISNCSVVQNSQTGIFSEGGGLISHCSVSKNGNAGVQVRGSSSIVNCEVVSNAAAGIIASSNSLILNNNCVGNGAVTPDGAGISVEGSGNRVESNNMVNNDIGIEALNGGNLIIKNSSRGGTKAYDIAAGNSMGQEVNVFNANTTTIVNTSNAWANFLY
jgi:hypothetical protein